MPLQINKPIGYTSHDIVAIARKQLGIKTIGHAGTLDPLASGLLIVLVGRSETKQQASIMQQDKEYVLELTLGYTSPTYDAEGPLQPTGAPVTMAESQLKNVLNDFIGQQSQRVPPYSAVQVNGKRLYLAARQGDTTIVPPVRQVIIHDIHLLNFTAPHVTLGVTCSHGTYMRSLAHDVGQALGVGAYVSNLCRTRIGQWQLSNAMSVEQLRQLSPAFQYGGQDKTNRAD